MSTYRLVGTLHLPPCESPEMDEWCDEDGNIDLIAYALAKGAIVEEDE